MSLIAKNFIVVKVDGVEVDIEPNTVVPSVGHVVIVETAILRDSKTGQEVTFEAGQEISSIEHIASSFDMTVGENEKPDGMSGIGWDAYGYRDESSDITPFGETTENKLGDAVVFVLEALNSTDGKKIRLVMKDETIFVKIGLKVEAHSCVLTLKEDGSFDTISDDVYDVVFENLGKDVSCDLLVLEQNTRAKK